MTEPFMLSGYSDTREFIAQRSHRGDYQTFTLALPISVLTTLVPTPDPQHRFEDNRQVNEAHARAFGKYWRANRMWITPPILLDTALNLNSSYEEISSVGSLTIGKIALPYDSDRQLRILDGQHRILGWDLISKTIASELAQARDSLLESQRLQNEIGIDSDQKRVNTLEAERRRLREEHITVEVLVGVTSEQHKKFFVDIAVHAKGISKSRTASFNQERMMSRIGLSVGQSHDLLRDLVDEERDRVVGTNRHFISLKNAIELCRESTWGVPSRWTDKRENLNSEDKLTYLASAFFDDLQQHAPLLQEMADRKVTPAKVRERSMLGSVSMLRVLAGVYAATAISGAATNEPELNPEGRRRFGALLALLVPVMDYVRGSDGGLVLNSVWSEHADTSKFFADAGAKSPSGRPQAMKEFVALLTDWAHRGVIFPPDDDADSAYDDSSPVRASTSAAISTGRDSRWG